MARRNVSISGFQIDDETGEVWLEGMILPADGSADMFDYGPPIRVKVAGQSIEDITDRENPVQMFPVPVDEPEPEPDA